MKNIKLRYYISILLIFLIYFLIIVILKGSLEFPIWITTSATLGATFAALLTAVIALGVADKPSRYVKFTLNAEVDKQHIATYNSADLPKELIRESDNDHLHSYRVYFKITNQSKFTLKNPVTTFHLPSDLAHPHKTQDNKWIPYFRSNLYNVQIDLRHFEYEENIVLSNNILPYLNPGKELPIWIRMCLSKKSTKPKEVYLDLNCDNAEGSTEKITIVPKEFLKDISPDKAIDESERLGRFST